MSDKFGASALLCFPPQSLAMGGHLRPEMVIEHFKRIADVTDLPLICFNYPSSGNLTYPFETLLLRPFLRYAYPLLRLFLAISILF